MFNVMMIIDDIYYKYGTYSDRRRANEIALQIAKERNCQTYVVEGNNLWY